MWSMIRGAEQEFMHEPGRVDAGWLGHGHFHFEVDRDC